MADAKIIDARGLSCPQPALMTRQALQQEAKGTVEVIVDNDTARENVCRAAGNLGWKVSVEELSDEEIRVVMTK